MKARDGILYTQVGPKTYCDPITGCTFDPEPPELINDEEALDFAYEAATESPEVARRILKSLGYSEVIEILCNAGIGQAKVCEAMRSVVAKFDGQHIRQLREAKP